MRQSTTGVLGAMLVGKYDDIKIIYTPKDIQADIKKAHEISLTYMQAWRGKQRAFKLLRGTVVNLKKTEENHLLYLFSALDASIRGWEYFRSIMVVDGTHLKSTYEGTMLIASTLDLEVAKEYIVQEFEECMGRLNEISPKLRAYLIKADFQKLSRCHAAIKRT
ncbi:hypothetical protein KY284_020303 [Solanum tuberosum]|nr:hypothetical protein KY284_020303 [Solanum tuberosum]